MSISSPHPGFRNSERSLNAKGRENATRIGGGTPVTMHHHTNSSIGVYVVLSLMLIPFSGALMPKSKTWKFGKNVWQNMKNGHHGPTHSTKTETTDQNANGEG